MPTPSKEYADEVLIRCLARGDTIPDAARVAKVSERTVFRRLANPTFRDRLSATQAAALSPAYGMLTTGLTDACFQLTQLVRHPNPHGRVQGGQGGGRPDPQDAGAGRGRGSGDRPGADHQAQGPVRGVPATPGGRPGRGRPGRRSRPGRTGQTGWSGRGPARGRPGGGAAARPLAEPGTRGGGAVPASGRARARRSAHPSRLRGRAGGGDAGPGGGKSGPGAAKH